MYDYRNLTPEQQEAIMDFRRQTLRPWHSPPHRDFEVERQFLVSAACYEHRPIIGMTPERMTACESALVEVCEKFASAVYAWCVLPNHYHLLIRTGEIRQFRNQIALLHGRFAHRWNGEDNSRGRKVWFNCFDRAIRSHGHYWASVNYIHHNPVKHGYAKKWQDWPWSSARQFLNDVGRETTEKLWLEYPILDYGRNWDEL